MPEALRGAWQNIEFGDYPAAAPVVKKAVLSNKPEIKSGGELLKAAVQKELDRQSAVAKQALDANKKWRAYQEYVLLGNTFRGYDLPADAVEAKKSLAADATVKQELSAHQNLEKIRKIMASGKPNSRKKAITMLDKLVKDRAGTEAAAEARTLLESLNQNAAASDSK